MADTSITSVREQRDRLKGQLARVREQAKKTAKLGTQGVLMAAGGAGAGALRAKLPNIPGTSIPTDMAVGVALTTLAAFDAFDGVNEEVLAIGGGMLAVATARIVEDALR